MKHTKGKDLIDKIKEWYINFNSVPLYIGGMVPSDPQTPNSGTQVAMFSKEGGDELVLGYSDENGEFSVCQKSM